MYWKAMHSLELFFCLRKTAELFFHENFAQIAEIIISLALKNRAE